MKTIFALSTAQGRAGVAIIRISGEGAFTAFSHFGIAPCPTPRMATRVRILAPKDNRLIDDALALYFPAPHSFTGEDVVEFQVHGSQAVIGMMIEELSAIEGFRLAEPGEFTRRALMNGKMDLAQVEGLSDLIDAQTQQQHAQALHFMEGKTSAFYEGLRARIIRNLAHLEAYIDFPEEDIPEDVFAALCADLSDLCQSIEARLANDTYGERIRDGFTIAIVGAPNVGKSSLLNALVAREAAIVSSQAGTTRDVIEVHLSINGYSVILADTAGIREQAEEVEREGIRRSLERMKQADLSLVMLDANEPKLPPEIATIPKNRMLLIINKCDAGQGISGFEAYQPICISVKNGKGIADVICAISDTLSNMIPLHEPSVITRTRHRIALQNTVKHLIAFNNQTLIELRCEELRRAAFEVGSVTGIIDIERVLDEIFRSFCIGK